MRKYHIDDIINDLRANTFNIDKDIISFEMFCEGDSCYLLETSYRGYLSEIRFIFDSYEPVCINLFANETMDVFLNAHKQRGTKMQYYVMNKEVMESFDPLQTDEETLKDMIDDINRDI